MNMTQSYELPPYGITCSPHMEEFEFVSLRLVPFFGKKNVVAF